MDLSRDLVCSGESPRWFAEVGGKRGGYQITVFTAPTPFRAGLVDISALVQDATTGDLVPHARLIVRMTKSGRVGPRSDSFSN